MEQLKSSWVCEIGVIRVGSKELVSVGRVLEAQVGCEIPEATYIFQLERLSCRFCFLVYNTIMGVSDKRDSLNEFLCFFWVDWDFVDEAESPLILIKN